jgi:glycosyltransferase involved in cell wall biosynthesis
MRILIVNYEFPPIGAGGGQASQKIAECLVEMGHSVRVITSRPTQLYTMMGGVSLLLGLGFWVYLAYAKLSWGEDISNHGFTLLGTLLLLTGFILRATGMIWELVMPIRGLKRVEFIEGVEIVRVPVLRQRQDYCSTFEMATFLVSGAWHSLWQAREFKPDVVHVFFGIPDGPIGWLLKRLYGLPYIISLRGADVPSDEVKRFARQYKVLRPFVRWLWHDADALVAVSNGLRSYAHETAPALPIQVIPNAIDLSTFIPARQRDRDGPVRLMYVGRFNAFKNVEMLIQAVARLQDIDVGDFELELVGEGEQRPALERLVSELGLTRQIHFSGWVARERIADYYRCADIFTTATTWEGMPNTVLEAMACGLPIVGTQASGLQELVKDGINGYLVPVKDVDALAKALAHLIDNGYERHRMGRESRKLAEREFAWQYIAEQYVEVYGNVLEKRHAVSIQTR